MPYRSSDDVPEDPSGAHASGSDQQRVLRNDRSRVIAWVALGAAVLSGVLTVVQVPFDRSPALLGLPAFIACLCWACYLRPRVELGADELTIVNIARTSIVPFSRIDEFDLRLGLTVRTKDGRAYGAWALPSSGRRARREGLSRARLERHVPDEITAALDAHARWQQDPDSPRRGAERDVVTHLFTPLPPTFLVLTLAWAIWGLSVAAAL